MVVDSPPGITRPETAARSAGVRTLVACIPAVLQHPQVFANVTLQGENPIRAVTSRVQRVGAARDLLHVDADHRLTESARHLRKDVRVLEVGRGRNDRCGSFGRIPGFEDPLPTNTRLPPVASSSQRVRGVAIPPAVNITTGRLPVRATSATRSYGACRSLAARYNSSSGRFGQPSHFVADGPHVSGRIRHIPVPASPCCGSSPHPR